MILYSVSKLVFVSDAPTNGKELDLASSESKALFSIN